MKIVRDILPPDVKLRRAILTKITAVIEKAGYAEVMTPTFEEYEQLSAGLPAHLKDAAYRFFDRRGVQMILRPDITTQIARVVGSKMAKVKGPLRLYYSGDVYRAGQLEIGQQNQFYQIGVELFDVPGARGEKEIIALAKAALQAVGLRNYRLDETNAGRINKLPLKAREALRRQDFAALGRLPRISELLAVDLDYYTGLYFECFVPEMGYILGSGGRYDNLCAVFGRRRAAVGFAFNLDKLVLALEAQGKK
ncbi:MAG: ATP phosphoribosyltransferase regulatory subunit [Candidatus Margulisbacteria bacterium]|jgi:ATP phosphoribosyltransferase regulatory subunit|nr:ATP phosphoribosyltransferase regulatory subunit [Candidatus Margulisiibacteriota bacterium]